MPQTLERIKLEPEALGLVIAPNGKLIPISSELGKLQTPGTPVSEDEASFWMSASQYAGIEELSWLPVNDERIAPEVRQELITAYLTQNTANDIAPNNLPVGLFAAAARLLGYRKDDSIPGETNDNTQSASFRATSNAPARNDDDSPGKDDGNHDSEDGSDRNDDDKYMVNDTLEDAVVMDFALAANETAQRPLNSAAIPATPADKLDSAKEALADEQPKGFLAKARAAMNQVFNTAKTVLGHQATQAALLAALPHGLSALAGATTAKIAVRGALAAAAGEIFPRLLERSEKTPTIKPEPAPQLV